MSAIEIDLIKFTEGERQGEYAVMFDYNGLMHIHEFSGKFIARWDSNEFERQEDTWTDGMRDTHQWLEQNSWEFPVIEPEHIKALEQTAQCYRFAGKQIAIGEHAPNANIVEEMLRHTGNMAANVKGDSHVEK